MMENIVLTNQFYDYMQTSHMSNNESDLSERNEKLVVSPTVTSDEAQSDDSDEEFFDAEETSVTKHTSAKKLQLEQRITNIIGKNNEQSEIIVEDLKNTSSQKQTLSQQTVDQPSQQISQPSQENEPPKLRNINNGNDEKQVLEQITIRNLDTGEVMTLLQHEELDKNVNPVYQMLKNKKKDYEEEQPKQENKRY